MHVGSSPLARGTRQSGAGKLTRRGLIPARAGNTGRVAVTGGVRRAHPRSRGEHRLSAHLYFDLPGSSPLARGTLTGGAPAICRVGLIPARAGNTCFRLSVRLASRAHPRSRGEHLKIWSGPPVVRGSSPLARGTHVLVHEGRGRVGLIPARAGNMEEPPPTPPVKWAHPRSRGEHRSHQNRGCRPTGSSPLARGTRARNCRSTSRAGLIPARAGNTPNGRELNERAGAHPRSRGEHSLQVPLQLRRWGSSPLARGTRFDIGGMVASVGLIPARAGNTEVMCWKNCSERAHPRSRGEHGYPIYRRW